ETRCRERFDFARRKSALGTDEDRDASVAGTIAEQTRQASLGVRIEQELHFAAPRALDSPVETNRSDYFREVAATRLPCRFDCNRLPTLRLATRVVSLPRHAACGFDEYDLEHTERRCVADHTIGFVSL